MPPMKDTYVQGKEKPQQDGKRGEIMLRIKPLICQRETLRGLKQTLCTPGQRDHMETKPELCLSVSVKAQVSSGWPQGQGLWMQQTWVWQKPSWRRSPLTPQLSCQNLHRTGETDSWGTQTEPCTHQDPGERSSDPTGDPPRLARECPRVSGRGLGQWRTAAGLGALSVALRAWDLLKEVAIIIIISTKVWP